MLALQDLMFTLWHPPWNYRIAPENRLKRPKRKLYSLPTIHFFQVLSFREGNFEETEFANFFLSNEATASTFERDGLQVVWPIISPIFRTDAVEDPLPHGQSTWHSHRAQKRRWIQGLKNRQYHIVTVPSTFTRRCIPSLFFFESKTSDFVFFWGCRKNLSISLMSPSFYYPSLV